MRQVLGALLVTAAAVSLAAQDPPRTFETAVNYVRVDMYPLAGDKPVVDLRVDEVELLEDGVPQTIEQFEHVQVAGRRPQTLRPEPSTMAEMQRALKDPRARVFVLFLDPRHVNLQGSMNVRGPLIDALNSLVGGDDVIAVMTPEMSPRGITFTRRTNNIEEMLSTYWGSRDILATRDAREIEYEACYNVPGGDGLAERMIARRREMVVLDALEAVEHLRTARRAQGGHHHLRRMATVRTGRHAGQAVSGPAKRQANAGARAAGCAVSGNRPARDGRHVHGNHQQRWRRRHARSRSM